MVGGQDDQATWLTIEQSRTVDPANSGYVESTQIIALQAAG